MGQTIAVCGLPIAANSSAQPARALGRTHTDFVRHFNIERQNSVLWYKTAIDWIAAWVKKE